MEASSQLQQRWRPSLITAVNLALAMPAMRLVLKGYFGTIEYTYGTFFFARIAIVALFILGVFAILWSVLRTTGGLRILQSSLFILHCVAFAVLVHWFGGVHRL